MLFKVHKGVWIVFDPAKKAFYIELDSAPFDTLKEAEAYIDILLTPEEEPVKADFTFFSKN